MFIEDNRKRLSNCDLKDLIEGKLQAFYIDLRVVYDKCLTKEEKSILKNSDNIYEETLYHRDKKYAHIDEDYKKKEYESLTKMIEDLKNKLEHCHEICKNKLPKEITLDYVKYDRTLFRLLNGITPEKENILNKMMYNNKMNVEDTKSKVYNVFDDVEDINIIKKNSDYCVIVENGINLYEMLQNRQDFCIKVNVLFKLNTWATITKNIEEHEKSVENDLIKLIKSIKE